MSYHSYDAHQDLPWMDVSNEVCARWADTQSVVVSTLGCPAYVLIPKAYRRKDWEDKAIVGYFIDYSKTKVGYRILLCDTVVTSVHMLFDESIPERGADYFRELDEATVKSHPE